MRLVKANEMREMDSITINELGIPGCVLMENAGRGAVRYFLEHFRPAQDSLVLVLCGPGNNGGDGYVISRYLHEKGFRVRVLLLGAREKIKGDALLNLHIIQKLSLDIIDVSTEEKWKRHRRLLKNADYLIDAILGTGLNSDVRGLFKTVIEDVNRSGRPVMAVDIPSGLNADSGSVMGTAVRAELTVTFGFPKLGQVIFPGASCVGRLVNIDIGIPGDVQNRVEERYRLSTPSDFVHLLYEGTPDIHKGRRGHLVVIAGSPGKTGAATLSSLGALRAGAGLVTLCVPESLNPVLEEKLTEAMTLPLPETDEKTLSMRALDKILEFVEGKSAIAIGPGLSTHPETVTLVRNILRRVNLPVVIDADGVNALSGADDLIKKLGKNAILTPHPGEMSRLINKPTHVIQADRVKVAEDFSSRYGCYLVLKGARSVISTPEGRVYINPTGGPVLSSGGSGDVLTGLIGGFLARGFPILLAGIAGVFIHGLAGDLMAQEAGQAGIYAGELLDVIPSIMNELWYGRWPLDHAPLHEQIGMII